MNFQISSFGADLPQAAAGKTATDGEEQCAPFTSHERGHADTRADQRAGIRSGNKSREVRTCERQVRRVVAEQNSCGHAGDERNSKAGREDEPLRPIAPFGQQNGSEYPEPREHRREDCRHGEIDDERDEQELVATEDQ